MHAYHLNRRQNGLVMVEFAIIALLFFTLLFAVIEFSRALFVWNAVADATRLGARAAAVCPVNDSVIKEITRYMPPGGGVLPPQITEDKVIVRYLDENGSEVANPAPGSPGFDLVRYVEVSIVNYQHTTYIPGLNVITMPPFTTTRPRESLGIIPDEPAGC